MRLLFSLLAVPLILSAAFAADEAAETKAAETKVLTEYTHTVTCDRKTKRGDKIFVHYRGTLADTGKQFDASYDRGQPLGFAVGQGSVIKGYVVAAALSGQGLLHLVTAAA